MILIFLAFVVFVLSFIYVGGKFNEAYWKRRGVVFYKKNKFIGPLLDFLLQDKAFFEILSDVYNEYPNEPAVGVGSFLTPALFIRDVNNIQYVLQTDFQSFNHRGFDINKDDVLADNVMFQNGNTWKVLRQNVTPLFTAAKMKTMYASMDQIAQDFVAFLKRNPEKLNANAFDSLSTFCSAAVAAATLGIGTEATFKSTFHKIASVAAKVNKHSLYKFSLGNISPKTFRMLNITMFKNYESYFIGVLKKLMYQREKENVKRNDFVDICLNLRKNGKMVDSENSLQLDVTDERLAAQVFSFFLAGVDPSAEVFFGTLVELGKHPEIQERLQEEIDKTYEKYNGHFTYQAICEMEYLEKVLNEGMRMHPPIGYMLRKCIKDSVLPVGNIKVSKGTKLYLPLYNVHYDSKYYPNPEIFDPERFSEKYSDTILEYFPFGKGNRICIASRYARFQIKAGLVHVLREFKVDAINGNKKFKYKKELVQVSLKDVDVKFVPRIK